MLEKTILNEFIPKMKKYNKNKIIFCKYEFKWLKGHVLTLSFSFEWENKPFRLKNASNFTHEILYKKFIKNKLIKLNQNKFFLSKKCV